ncbi:probable cyclin-dependent serine/threonine-protein kinase DDB_G0292550 [Teleopsis dalmanni]|uniref:probable cyclin-dependent serine/threonine-protein kinase DDB_G0292550 n=1 Tax=Teleopsis dalmanni TaxID=139649 RepID=UPI0018CFE803|nr:probable cyclin-dependent serine/threonine-protein kinase DDB_G0292550 [Teleopsis dalmanni]
MFKLSNFTLPQLFNILDLQKRRRFHPLRNLRRIFRRRTITNPTDTPTSLSVPQQPTSSTSEKNLRSATLSSISSVVSASSPSSPLTHQQIQESYSSQSLPKSKSYGIASSIGAAVLGRDAASKKQKTKQQQQLQQQQLQQLRDQTSAGTTIINDNDMYTTTTSSTSSYHHSHHTQNYAKHTYVGPGNTPQRQSIGVAVLPTAMNRSFFSERQKLRSVGDSSQDLDSSGNGSGSNIDSNNAGRTNDNNSGGEMSDSQRSLSEGRLVDSDYNTQDQLSQSHDSVFSESATASSLSSVLKHYWRFS